MQKEHQFYSGAVVYNAYIDGLLKGRNTQKAVEIFQRMKRDRCKPSTDTYTMMINLYGKVPYHLFFSYIVFNVGVKKLLLTSQM